MKYFLFLFLILKQIKNTANCADLFTRKIALALANFIQVAVELRASFGANISLQFAAFFICFSIISSSVFCGTVRLYNDSPYKLRAIVRGNDGSYLGEIIMAPQGFSTWSDSNTQFGVYGKDNPYSMGPSMSQIPYTVMWYCMEGSPFSVCTNVFTGQTVAAQSCDGLRICKPVPKNQQQPLGPDQGEQLSVPPPPPGQEIEQDEVPP